jgi:hypothetical protein
MNTKVRWTASFLMSGVQSLFGNRPTQNPSRMQKAIREIRTSMLECLSQYGVSNKTSLHMRVAYANDIQDLWYLRGDVLAVIASTDGEAVAKKKMKKISVRFRGLLPKGLVARHSPLDDLPFSH